jgi:carbon monoxide dehydrogenase subunit G
MRLSGAATMQANPEAVYAAFNDPAVLARCLPGCEQLTEIGPSHYTMTITAGVAAIKGTYAGEVALVDGTPPSAFTLKASAAGGPGTVSADVLMRLAPSATGGTDLTYDADAVVGGTLGGVGQRMLNGVAKKLAGQFFAAVDTDIATGIAVVVPEGELVGADAAVGSAAGAAAVTVDSSGARVFPGKAAARAGAGAGLGVNQGAAYLIGALVGGALALAGVALGARIARRR